MRTSFGRVAGLDRTNRQAWVLHDEHPRGPLVPVDVGGAYPAPLSTVELEEYANGRWVTRPSVDLDRIILHDDFTAVIAACGYGDTFWRSNISAGAGSGIIPIGTIADTQGAVLLRASSAAGNTNIEKDTTTFPPANNAGALWWSSKHAIGFGSSGVGTGVWRFGFGNDQVALITFAAGYAGAWWTYAGNLNQLVLQCAVGGAASSSGDVKEWCANGVSPGNAVYDWFDIVCCGDGFVAGWVNGVGPIWLEATLPTTATPMEAFYNVQNTLVGTVAASFKDYYADWCHVETVPEVAHPSLFNDIDRLDIAA